MEPLDYEPKRPASADRQIAMALVRVALFILAILLMIGWMVSILSNL